MAANQVRILTADGRSVPYAVRTGFEQAGVPHNPTPPPYSGIASNQGLGKVRIVGGGGGKHRAGIGAGIGPHR